MLLGNNIMVLVAFVYSFALPVGLLIWWKKKTGAKLWSFLAGALCFTIFAYGLESVLHQFALGGASAWSQAIINSPLLFTLYGAFAAGIFEETARLFGFKVLLKKQEHESTAVAYGIGHGGIEVILVLGLAYFVYTLALCGVPLGTQEATAQVADVARSLPAGAVLLAMAERLSAMMLHIGLSMLMFVAARDAKKLWLYPVSVCIHALADVPACLYQYQLLRSLAAVEITAFVMGLAMLFIGARVLKARGNAASEEAQAAEIQETVCESESAAE